MRSVTRSAAARWPEPVTPVYVDTYLDTPPPLTDNDVLIHFAQPNVVADPVDRYEAIKIVKHLTRLGYRRINYASSAAVYSDRSSKPHRPDEQLSADTLYAALKLESERLVESSRGIVMRLANMYGLGHSNRSVLSRILSQIPGSGPLIVQSVSPVRDFCWVGDAAAAALDLCASDVSGIFNIGSGRAISIGELARAALEMAGESDRSVVSEEPAGVPSVLTVDISETTKACGWVPRTTLVEGLKRMMAGTE